MWKCSVINTFKNEEEVGHECESYLRLHDWGFELAWALEYWSVTIPNFLYIPVL